FMQWCGQSLHLLILQQPYNVLQRSHLGWVKRGQKQSRHSSRNLRQISPSQQILGPMVNGDSHLQQLRPLILSLIIKPSAERSFQTFAASGFFQLYHPGG
ncbi:MAG TPA: hypothetical protein VHR42_08995, partial [Clostridia bacterium]|nr:hypothetical protein [Clostridia bacterium]